MTKNADHLGYDTGNAAIAGCTRSHPLHPDTETLVQRFAEAMRNKLANAERKYGYSNLWANSGWMEECRTKLVEHLHKGDPLDVANYCAFLWHHGEHCRPESKGNGRVECLKEFEKFLASGNTSLADCWNTRGVLAERELAAEREKVKTAELMAEQRLVAAHLRELGLASVKLAAAQATIEEMREALERIGGFTLSQFMGPHDMALECGNVARAAIASVKGGAA